MRRFLLIAIALCAMTGIAAGTAIAATKLTSKNSVSFPFGSGGELELNGVGCGSSASAIFAVKEGARNLVIKSPKIGDTTLNKNVRVSAITVAENVATFVMTADGASICDAGDDDVPPAQRPWKAFLDVKAEYDRRIQVPVRTNFADTLGAKVKVKPKSIMDGSGQTGEKYYGLKWRSFGGKKAVGNGRLRQYYCNVGACPQNRARARLTLTNPGYCKATGEIEYRHIKISVAGRGYAEIGDNKNSVSYCGA